MKATPKLATASLPLCLIAAVCLVPSSYAQDAKTAAAETAASHTIPAIDGAIGTCTANFTVTDDAAAPVYDAKIRVHIAYGFMYLHKMDLEVGFQASKADRAGTAFVDPSTTCKADLTVVLQKKMQ
jgi:hypothetical protein